MMAQIGWIDFSNADRKKAQQLLSLIRPEGQLDELGVGSVRDALANQLFPGISTIQTRAKYFFIIPNILRSYQQLPASKKRNTSPALFLKEEQHKVKNAFKEKYNSEEGIGIIGVTLGPRKYIKRNPSEIYWNGLQVYGFMNSKGLTQDQFLRNLYTSNVLERSATELEEDDTDINHENGIDIHCPVHMNWFKELSISLNKEESDYFRTQIKLRAQNTPYSLLPLLLQQNELLKDFVKSDSFQSFALRSRDLDFKPEAKQLVILSHDFAELMEGVHLLYNHLLQQHFFPNDYARKFSEEWILWRNELENTMLDYDNFNPTRLLPHVKYPRINTLRFIEDMWRLVRSSSNDAEPTASIIELVRRREQQTKGTKSRLTKPASSNVDITLDQRIGLSQFQYRYYNARTIIKDIINPE